MAYSRCEHELCGCECLHTSPGPHRGRRRFGRGRLRGSDFPCGRCRLGDHPNFRGHGHLRALTCRNALGRPLPHTRSVHEVLLGGTGTYVSRGGRRDLRRPHPAVRTDWGGRPDSACSSLSASVGATGHGKQLLARTGSRKLESRYRELDLRLGELSGAVGILHEDGPTTLRRGVVSLVEGATHSARRVLRMRVR